MASLDTPNHPSARGQFRMQQTVWIADILLLLVAIIWGSSYITAKTVVSVYPVFLFLFLRFTLTVLMLTPFTFRAIRHASKQTWKVGGILGVFLFLIFSFETLGIAHTSAANSGFLISLCIVLVPLVGSIVYKKRPHLAVIGVVLLSVVGTGLLTIKEGYQFNYGDLLILAAALMRAVQMVYTKKLTEGKEFHSGALTTIQLGIVAILTGCVAFAIEPRSFAMLLSTGNAQFWLITLYLALFGTIFAFYVQMTMIRRTSALRVGLLLGTEPLFGALFAVLFGGESLTLYGMIGGCLIVSATYIGRQLESRL